MITRYDRKRRRFRINKLVSLQIVLHNSLHHMYKVTGKCLGTEISKFLLNGKGLYLIGRGEFFSHPIGCTVELAIPQKLSFRLRLPTYSMFL